MKSRRTIIRVTNKGQHYIVCVPSWNPHIKFSKPLDFIPKEYKPKFNETVYLFCYVNTKANSLHELTFNNFELAPEPNDNDGLA